jgi:hypothetical protein
MRITELKLPLDHTESELHGAILRRLGIAAEDIAAYVGGNFLRLLGECMA